MTTLPSQLSTIFQRYGRTLALLAAIVAGILIPQAQAFSGLIQYFVFGMLFLSFVGMQFDRSALRPSLLIVLLANVCVALAAFFLLIRVDGTLALAAFMTGITPTAIATPVVIGLLERRVSYVVAAVLLNNVAIALIIPFLLPWVAGGQVVISMWDVLWSVLKVVILPLILARLVRYLPEPAQKPIFQAKRLTFVFWMSSLFLVTAKASYFIYNNVSVPWSLLIQIAIISFIICIVNFSLGALIGGREFRREASQALGQKNLSFTIWLALTFINPVVALGPTFYVIFHNLYNSFQLYWFAKEKVRTRP
jgi:BASS family bile acid:Na+ symporter